MQYKYYNTIFKISTIYSETYNNIIVDFIIIYSIYVYYVKYEYNASWLNSTFTMTIIRMLHNIWCIKYNTFYHTHYITHTHMYFYF